MGGTILDKFIFIEVIIFIVYIILLLYIGTTSAYKIINNSDALDIMRDDILKNDSGVSNRNRAIIIFCGLCPVINGLFVLLFLYLIFNEDVLNKLLVDILEKAEKESN